MLVSTQKHRVDPLRSFACETLALKALSAGVQDSHLPWEMTRALYSRSTIQSLDAMRVRALDLGNHNTSCLNSFSLKGGWE